MDTETLAALAACAAAIATTLNAGTRLVRALKRLRDQRRYRKRFGARHELPRSRRR